MKSCLPLLLLGCASVAQAQEPGYRFDDIAPGSSVLVGSDSGLVLEHVFSKGSWGKNIVTVFEIADGQKSEFARFQFNRAGRLIKAARPDGESLEFRPHGCTNVIGQCSYELVYSDGQRENRVQTMQAKDEGYQITTFAGDGTVISQTYRTDDSHGWPLTSTDTRDGKTVTFTRLESSYQ